MKLEFPKVTKEIRLGDYEPEMGEGVIHVHVNVPRATIDQIHDFKEMKDADLFAWLSELWSPTDPLPSRPQGGPQGDEASWPVNEIEALWNHCHDKDPGLWAWLVEQTVTLLIDYRTGIKKA